MYANNNTLQYLFESNLIFSIFNEIFQKKQSPMEAKLLFKMLALFLNFCYHDTWRLHGWYPVGIMVKEIKR
jgi:hypothetical protein